MTYSKLMRVMLLTVAVLGLMSVATACEISGYKYQELGDGTKYVDHPLQGWNIYLFKEPLSPGTAPSATAPGFIAQRVTGADGKYNFDRSLNLNYGKYYVYEEVRPGWTQLTGGIYPATSSYTVTFSSIMSDAERKVSGLNFVNKQDKVCYKGETAWAAGTRYVEKGNWATYTTYMSGSTVTIYAGQKIDAGTVTFSAPVNGKVTITINLKNGAVFSDAQENLKIQGYDGKPLAKNPAPGKFTTYKSTFSGSSATITVPQYAYYGIHLDVKVPSN